MAAASIALLAYCPPTTAISPSAEESKQGAAFVAGLMGQLEAVAIISAAWAAEKLCDPKQCSVAQNYREPAVPAIPAHTRVTDASLAMLFSTAVPPSLVAELRTAMEQQAFVTSTEIAVVATIDRRYSAKMRHDEASQQLQNRRLRVLIALAAAQKRTANVRWRRVLRSIGDVHVRMKPLPNPQTYAAELAQNGLPERETQLLRFWHVSAADTNGTLAFLIAKGKRTSATYRFGDFVRQLMAANEHNEDMAHCSCIDPEVTS